MYKDYLQSDLWSEIWNVGTEGTFWQIRCLGVSKVKARISKNMTLPKTGNSNSSAEKMIVYALAWALYNFKKSFEFSTEI